MSRSSHLLKVSLTLSLLIPLLSACGRGGPSIDVFSSDASTITAGQQTRLYWQVSKAGSRAAEAIFDAGSGVNVSIDPDVGDVSGKTFVMVSPTTTTTYTLTLQSAAGKSSVQTTVTVTPAEPPETPTNAAPVANAKTISTEEDTPVFVNLTGSDAEGDALTYQVLSPPAHGTLSGDAPKLTYTPNQNYSGTDSFTFTVSDGELTSEAATVTVNVGEVGDAPTNLTLSNAKVPENRPEGTMVGSFSAQDADSTRFSYSLPTGEADNASFKIDGSDLKTAAAFDFEDKKEYSVRVEVKDEAGNAYQKSFAINVEDVDEEDPKVTLDKPGALTLNQAVTLMGTASDNVSVTSVTLFEDDTELATVTPDNNGGWSYSYTPKNAGDITLKAVATDDAGNTGEASQEVFVTGTTRQGNVTVANQAELDALANVSTITGTLTVNAQDILDLEPLNALREVGSLYLNNNPNLMSAEDLENLERVGFFINISQNNALENLPAFAKLERVVLIDINGNASLTSIDGFKQVTNTDTIYINYNPKLTSISGFDKLTSNTVFNSEVIGNTQLDCPAQNLTFAPVLESFGNLVDCPRR